MPPRRIRLGGPLLLLLGLSACYVASAAPRSSVAARRPALPVSVLVCGDPADSAAVRLLDADRLFERATHDPASPTDLIASVRVLGLSGRTTVSPGFFIWTLGIIPWMTRAHLDVQVLFQRRTPGVTSCPPAPRGESSSPGAEGLLVGATGKLSTVQGWAALLLQPTPWWSDDAVNTNRPIGAASENLPLRTREALSRAIVAHGAELRALAGR